MESKVGVIETKEVLIGANELTVEILKATRDGFQPLADFSALYLKYQSDAAFKAKIDAAFGNAKGAIAEVQDIQFGEGVELVQVQVSYVPKILAALKGA